MVSKFYVMPKFWASFDWDLFKDLRWFYVRYIVDYLWRATVLGYHCTNGLIFNLEKTRKISPWFCAA